MTVDFIRVRLFILSTSFDTWLIKCIITYLFANVNNSGTGNPLN